MSTVIITDGATLRGLDVSNNDISDDGMALVSEALQHNKSLTTLGVVECGLSVKGTVVCVQVAIKFDIIVKHSVPQIYMFIVANLVICANDYRNLGNIHVINFSI